VSRYSGRPAPGGKLIGNNDDQRVVPQTERQSDVLSVADSFLIPFARRGLEIVGLFVGKLKPAVDDINARSKRRPTGREADREDQFIAVFDHVL
jgi:hypothetical protein